VSIDVRPVTGYAALERWVDLRNEVVTDDPHSAQMIALIRASESQRVDLLALEGDEPVGTGMLAGDPNSLESSYPYVEVMVPERNRGRGVGTALIRALSAHARALGKDGLHCDTREHDTYTIAFLERRGFFEVGRIPLLRLDLDRVEAVEPAPPDGVELARLAERPDLLQGMYAVAETTYPEIGGHIAKEAGSLRDWQLYELGDPRLLFEMTPIALAGGNVVGFATMLCLPDGVTAAHRITTVLPDWRGRGIGTVLARAQIVAAKRAGLRAVTVWQRTELVRRLFVGLGFETLAVSIDYHGPLQDLTD
jgi:GNAT superfamily N-acetyltransferase